ncbi:hypothetical protein [Natronorubrum thiooxidans]|uniref:Uncharacterized protein n=1 Tax=Natronorubrum thiooxidans TaxID=308853 RepID=A0A1N7H3N0_9EURY|nr:hypothetical protein [Natronorubrum thiooxidans]SIS19298.1 hypothetical protein SAMN05421752_12228 [Natronorubrum thiooxidans]
MPDGWISPDAESDEKVRIARIEEFEEGVATFGIYDARPEPGEDFEMDIVIEAYQYEEEVPDEYRGRTIFRVVPHGDGEFSIFSTEYASGKVESDQHILGLQFDPELTEIYDEYVEQVIRDDNTEE